MKKIIIPVISLCLLLTGCWDLTEAEKLGLITILGIDLSNDGQIKVFLEEMPLKKQSISSESGGGSAKALDFHEAVAPTLSEAIEKIYASYDRRIYYAHTNAIIMSEEMVSSRGIEHLKDFLERTPQIRRNTWVLVSMKDEFNKIFDVGSTSATDDDAGKVIKEIIKNRRSNSSITANTLGEFLNLSWETGSEPYTSGIFLKKVSINADDQSMVQDKIRTYDLNIGNTAVFKKDKLVGWLDNTESKGLLWVKGGIKGGYVSVNYGDKKVALKILRANSNIKPQLIDENMQVNIDIKVESRISESQGNLDFTDKELVNKIEDLQAEEVKEQIYAALDKSRSLDADIFGFGNCFFGKYPKLWKQIEDEGFNYYREVKVDIDVYSKVSLIGLIKK